MKKILLFLLVSSQFGWSQNTGQNVVNFGTKQLFGTNTITLANATTYNSIVIQNIGQTSHGITIIQQSGTAGQTYNFVMQGAVDDQGNSCGSGTNWFNIGPPTTVSSATFPLASNGSGFQPYPCLRVQINATTTNAVVTVNYQGSSNPSHNLIDSIASSDGIVGQVTSIPGAGNASIVVPLVGTKVVIYWLTLDIPTTATSGVTLRCNSSSGTIIYQILNATGVYILPNSVREYLTCPIGQTLFGVSAAGTGFVVANIGYRLE